MGKGERGARRVEGGYSVGARNAHELKYDFPRGHVAGAAAAATAPAVR